jgi:hypothetical protein
MKYTEEQVREAAKRTGAYDGHCERLIAELRRPAIEFAEGELLVDIYKDGSCLSVRTDDCMKYINYRVQTQSEHGPAVRELVEAVNDVASSPGTNERASRDLWSALDAYNARHPDE